MPNKNDVSEFAKNLFEKDTGRHWSNVVFSERADTTPLPVATDEEKERYIQKARIEINKLQKQKD